MLLLLEASTLVGRAAGTKEPSGWSRVWLAWRRSVPGGRILWARIYLWPLLRFDYVNKVDNQHCLHLFKSIHWVSTTTAQSIEE